MNVNINNNALFNSLQNNIKIKNNQSNNKISNNCSNSTISSEKELLEIINNLFFEDEDEKINSIIIIHEILCSKYQQNKFILIPNIDNIIKIFIKISHRLFDSIDNLKNKVIELKFTKYLVTILYKLMSNKELIIHISYKVIYDLCYEFLNYLLINGLDQIGSNQEGIIIFKSINSAMIRIIENYDTTSVILIFLEIIKQIQNNINLNLLSNLAVKCLIKTTQNIQSIINNIQLDKILLEMHLLIYNYDKIYRNNTEQNSKNDFMYLRFIKSFIIDIVKIKRSAIMEDYNKSVGNNQYKDKYIITWIKTTLESIGFSMSLENNSKDLNENSDDDNNIKLRNTRSNSTKTNIKKNMIYNSDKKRKSSSIKIKTPYNLNKRNSETTSSTFNVSTNFKQYLAFGKTSSLKENKDNNDQNLSQINKSFKLKNNLNSENNKLTQELDIKKKENIKLFKEINKEKEKNRKLTDELVFAKNENIRLKKELNIQKINNLNLNEQLNSFIIIEKKLKNEINELQFDLKSKNIEIQNLNNELNKLTKTQNEKIMAINIISNDENIIHAIACKNTDIFDKIKEELFLEYPDYEDKNSYFTVCGNIIKTFKSIQENNIKNHDKIILNFKNNS